MCSQNSLFDFFQFPTRGSTWHLQTTNKFKLIACRLCHLLWLSSEVQRAQSCHCGAKPLTPWAHLENAHLCILRNFYHSTQMPLTTWSILITTSTNSPLFKFSFAALHFLRVLSIAKKYSLQPLQNTFTRLLMSL